MLTPKACHEGPNIRRSFRRWKSRYKRRLRDNLFNRAGDNQVNVLYRAALSKDDRTWRKLADRMVQQRSQIARLQIGEIVANSKENQRRLSVSSGTSASTTPNMALEPISFACWSTGPRGAPKRTCRTYRSQSLDHTAADINFHVINLQVLSNVACEIPGAVSSSVIIP